MAFAARGAFMSRQPTLTLESFAPSSGQRRHSQLPTWGPLSAASLGKLPLTGLPVVWLTMHPTLALNRHSTRTSRIKGSIHFWFCRFGSPHCLGPSYVTRLVEIGSAATPTQVQHR
ncbi:hypothetical protein SKAU_G00176710 [Synaphobranchus kaupii]|uniref:Uncharacterized protein n=1 Tax=Synaphobranchus kaupii TaxID=118154 RepID=A0A9Q1FLK2_SYNKA|nr:hypothetical protein SKAU_G00176710 [Synaphobranchus kaupii]